MKFRMIESWPDRKPCTEAASTLTLALAAALVCVGGCTSNPVDVKNSYEMEFVLVQPGVFMMGCSEGDTECLGDERPQHPVKITQAFYLGKHEVTQKQWTAIMGNNPSRFRGDDRPVENVSWNDVQEFIHRLNGLEGTSKYRLPTEAEWEYAARAGVATKFPFDATRAGEHAWYWNNSDGETHPVGGKQPNPWGLHDMHGNVWEWVQDWYGEGYYASSLTSSSGTIVQPKELMSGPKIVINDPKGAIEGSGRVLRGGSWGNDLRYLRSAHRNAYAPDYRNANTGFRLAVTSDSDWVKNAETMRDEAKKRAASEAEAAKKVVEPIKNVPELKAPALPNVGPFGVKP
ncbi:MAG: formylglycine-generating enzyme family protein [Betaproteobacteria bacterium]|nr:formylglycine-generating enzyme family protein [Betaproteobacteria bacterium]